MNQIASLSGGIKVTEMPKIRFRELERHIKKVSFRLSPKEVEMTSVRPDSPGSNESVDTKSLPRLRGGLERVLYQPINLHKLKDARSGVYNYEESLEVITSPSPPVPSSHSFTPPHRDSVLLDVAAKYNRRYVSSTSSMTSILSHLHFLISNHRKLNIQNSSITKNFPQKSCSPTTSAHLPASVILRKLNKVTDNHDGDSICSIDSDPSLDKEMILSALGHTLEEFLTRGTQHHSLYDRVYHYSKIDDFILRSQLDCYDPKLPGTGVFDLKTRAVSAIRYDLSYIEKQSNYTGYEINKLHGPYESMEREFFDLIRSALLKYSLQARIGNMDGIFVAYHNIRKIFGFQYIPLDEMDYILHSDSDSTFKRILRKKERTYCGIYGDKNYILNHEYEERKIASLVADHEFKLSVLILKQILKEIENQFKIKGVDWEKLKILMKTYPTSDGSILKIVALPIDVGANDKTESLSFNDCATTDQVLERVKEVRKFNDDILNDNSSDILGFEVKVSNLMKGHKRTIAPLKFPELDEQPQLSAEIMNFWQEQLKIDYYKDSSKWSHPNFIDPLDVLKWTVNVDMQPIKNKNNLKLLYKKLAEEKLNMIDEACKDDILTDIEEKLEPSSIAIERIMKFMKQEMKHSEGKYKKKDHEKNFGHILRAYGEKSALKNQI
ncbi:hypothetical protein Kpol_206p5 [Vanderwaltozyma polyspora DSM 70294]|uniref:Pet127p n=1 Tax=Vanderwaltozyma polyspora (strain ATCC 22028 / DSM 70294 / BCRC 21397 / CBS 2163 / NBRC 10782 / NRRL Y-8283 / UCD 57-17) TaxID=436907 RepID=A7TTH4_VANPO|nr:uncharacterized protein Kpol_206p5 [Vanderwaltozyma polyspora DSM 70294]EDO14437.1 hypothetical protein Kpol_206p5 [Vanderwaltozyma polyspora DSM 70294]